MLCTTNPLFDLNVITAPSVQAFESRLDKAWKVQLLKFNYKEELRLHDLDKEETPS